MGCEVGCELGALGFSESVGLRDFLVGVYVGSSLGAKRGCRDGLVVGLRGFLEPFFVGTREGRLDLVGFLVGALDGFTLETVVCFALGALVGEFDGDFDDVTVGVFVGAKVVKAVGMDEVTADGFVVGTDGNGNEGVADGFEFVTVKSEGTSVGDLVGLAEEGEVGKNVGLKLLG